MSALARLFDQTTLQARYTNLDLLDILHDKLNELAEAVKEQEGRPYRRAGLKALEAVHNELEDEVLNNRRALNKLKDPKTGKGLGDGLVEFLCVTWIGIEVNMAIDTAHISLTELKDTLKALDNYQQRLLGKSLISENEVFQQLWDKKKLPLEDRVNEAAANFCKLVSKNKYAPKSVIPVKKR